MKKLARNAQLEFHFKKVFLPEVKIILKHRKVGKIVHLVSNDQAVLPLNKQEVSVSTRRKECVFKFPNKDRIIITDKKTHPPYDGIDAILSTSTDGSKWLFHKKKIDIETCLESESQSDFRNFIKDTWSEKFLFKRERRNDNGEVSSSGLRLPQIGALHAISSHWTLSNKLANIVIPTGGGKTETMLSVLISEQCKCLLVIVPSRTLRKQTASKFLNFGVLRATGNVKASALNPVVGILEHRPKEESDLSIFDRCNVVVTVINTIAQGTATEFRDKIAEKCSHLIIDEAHHVGAGSWSSFRNAFEGKPILQFTATPYREDRTSIDGDVIYDYPLRKAQEDGLFKSITFKGVFKTDRDKADNAIATTAVNQLKEDLSLGFDHRLMARCRNINRAKTVYRIYKTLSSELNPILIFNNAPNIDQKIEELRSGESKIVVCVNMLAEGFDLPELKIAAMHDKFKSLAITLQFTGRFTRSSSSNIGVATIVANTGFEDVSESLQSLYDEDPDWDLLISKLSFDRIEEEKQLLEFLQKADKIITNDTDDFSAITPKSLAPRLSTVVYRCRQFHPHLFYKGLEKGQSIIGAWLNKDPTVLFFVTRSLEKPIWCKIKKLVDRYWNIYSIYFSSDKGLLFIHSSFDSNNLHLALSSTVSNGTANRIEGETIFRVFGNINRLFLGQVGLLQIGPRNLRYSMFTGRDVGQAISSVISGQSQKSNISGSGYEDGNLVNIGCSKKGKIWGRDQGPIQKWANWCDYVGNKILDDTINVENLIKNVLVPTEVKEFPTTPVLFIDWPDKLNHNVEDKISLISDSNEFPFHSTEIKFIEISSDQLKLLFNIITEGGEGIYSINLSDKYDYNYSIQYESGVKYDLRIWSKQWNLEEYLLDYPPILFFTDQSELHGNLYTEASEPKKEIPMGQIYSFNWDGVNIRTESRWKNGKIRKNSIQEWAFNQLIEEGFSLIYDDDGSNEMADIIGIREDEDAITVRLVHCKWSEKAKPGYRIKDAVEVASQATKNVKWLWNFNKLLNRMSYRERDKKENRPSRYFKGSHKTINYFRRLFKIKGKINKEVIVAQPGISRQKISPEIISVFGAADAYTKVTIESPLIVWCNK